MALQESQPARRRPRGRVRAVRRVSALLAALLIGTAGLSYVQALTFPGDASWQVRTVGWVRDNGGAGLVDAAENWWFAHNVPTGPAPAPGSLPEAAVVAAPVVSAVQPPTLPLPRGAAALPGEGQWVPGSQRVGGVPALYTGYFRPDPAFPSQIVGAAWMDQSLTATHLIGGTREPGGNGGPEKAQVPTSMRSTLVAAFNSGWKMKDISGGYYADGRAAVPLRDGAASLVIDTAGTATVGQWGRDMSMSPQVAAVRQNLTLIIDQGQPVPGLADNSSGAWGGPNNQFQYTWRSAVGTDRTGNLIYIAGDKLTLSGLAHAMVAVGVQRGMELDIHPGMVTFTAYRTAPGAPFGLGGTKLLPGMSRPVTRYLAPDQRDFLAVTLRTPAGSGTAR